MSRKGHDEALSGVARDIWRLFERIEERGHPRARAFEDWLEMMTLAHAARTDTAMRSHGRPAPGRAGLEDAYLAVAERYRDEGTPVGDRSIDLLCQAHAMLTLSIVDKRDTPDVLGTIFEACISFGERGQYFTPWPLCQMNAALMLTGDVPEHPTISDPACGSGRMLLAVAELQPGGIFFGQDADVRCCQMTVLNLLLRGLHGYVTWGDSLALEARRQWRTAGGWLVEMDGDPRPVPIVHDVVTREPAVHVAPALAGVAAGQGSLFDLAEVSGS